MDIENSYNAIMACKLDCVEDMVKTLHDEFESSHFHYEPYDGDNVLHAIWKLRDHRIIFTDDNVLNEDYKKIVDKMLLMCISSKSAEKSSRLNELQLLTIHSRKIDSKKTLRNGWLIL